MKKKFITPIVLGMTVSLLMPMYVCADDSGSGSGASSSITTSNTSTSSGADESSTSSSTSTTPSNLSLSLEDALNRVEKGYNTIVLDDRYIEILDKQYQEDLANQQSLKETAGSSMVEDDAKTLKLNAPVALYNLNNEKHQREIDLKNAKVSVTSEYENILAAQMNVDYISEEISNLQKDMDLINAKIKVGVDKASDIEQDKATMAQYQASLNSAKNGIQSSMISLKNDLGIDLNTELTLTSKPMDYVKFDDTDIEGKIQTAIQNSYSMQALKQDIENTQIEYSIYKEYSDSQKDDTEVSIEDKQNQLNQMPNSIEVQLMTQYNALKSLENTVEADKLSVEAAQISVDTAQANYNSGRITYLELLNAQLQLSQAKNTLQQDIISYMVSVTNVQNSLEEQ
ncbi:TolC family protein [Clostridium sp. WILCCON 0269]|uniref:TolC family protein n=1 Tax=Candidatus Clostridium eludens TaxID=3381663 RepID=A0ABW8SEA8_9CLOT